MCYPAFIFVLRYALLNLVCCWTFSPRGKQNVVNFVVPYLSNPTELPWGIIKVKVTTDSARLKTYAKSKSNTLSQYKLEYIVVCEVIMFLFDTQYV